MDIKRALAIGIIGVIGMVAAVNGCAQKPAGVKTTTGNVDSSLIVKETRQDLKYPASIDIGQSGLELDRLNENVAVSPDGTLGVLAASKVPKGKLPKGQQIDYESHLVLVDLIGGRISSLDKGQYMLPMEWSPQGDKLLYRKDDNLYIADTADRSTHRIAVGAYSGSISPDGTKVAFVQRGKGLFICDTDGTNVKKLSGEPGDWYPLWYPDGRALFYFADRQAELGDGVGRLQGLRRIDVETGKKDVLVPGEKGKYRRAEWIIPGKTLVVDKGWDDGFYEIVVNLASGGVYQLGEKAGTKTYSTAVDKAQGIVYKAQGSKITGIDGEGREIVSLIIEKPERIKFTQNSGLAVSPDGRLLAYLAPERSSGDGQDGSRVWIVNADSFNPEQLSGDFSGHYAPVWTPGGKNLIILDTGNGKDADRGIKLKVLSVDLK